MTQFCRRVASLPSRRRRKSAYTRVYTFSRRRRAADIRIYTFELCVFKFMLIISPASRLTIRRRRKFLAAIFLSLSRTRSSQAQRLKIYAWKIHKETRWRLLAWSTIWWARAAFYLMKSRRDEPKEENINLGWKIERNVADCWQEAYWLCSEVVNSVSSQYFWQGRAHRNVFLKIDTQHLHHVPLRQQTKLLHILSSRVNMNTFNWKSNSLGD